MTNTLLISSALVAALLVSGCGSKEPAPTVADSADAATPAAAPTPTEVPAASTPEPAAAPSSEAPSVGSPDGIRGPGGLEEKCAQRVAQETGAKVNGTNRIEESEAAVEVYLNVEGAAAPWKCTGSRDGTISEVMFAGDEGAA